MLGAPGSPSPGAPPALAVEVAELVVVWTLVNDTAPPAERLRAVVAPAFWLAMVRARATPTAAVVAVPVTAPAVVAAPAVWVAVAAKAPVRVVVAPVPSDAVVVTFDKVMAAAGTAATDPPPEAPILASVVAMSVVVAEMVRFLVPVRTAPLSRPATVRSLMMLSATEAPTPTEEPPVEPTPTGSAFTSDVALAAATKVAAAVVPVRVAVPFSCAVVVTFSSRRAKDPARDTFVPVPPAPEAEEAPKVSTPLFGPPGVMVASKSRPAAVTVSPTGRTAVFFTLARVMATPAPMPSEVPPALEPSAVEVSPATALEESVRMPPEVMLRPVPGVVVLVVVATVMPMAAATEILPPVLELLASPLELALGVAVAPVPPPGGASLSAPRARPSGCRPRCAAAPRVGIGGTPGAGGGAGRVGGALDAREGDGPGHGERSRRGRLGRVVGDGEGEGHPDGGTPPQRVALGGGGDRRRLGGRSREAACEGRGPVPSDAEVVRSRR